MLQEALKHVNFLGRIFGTLKGYVSIPGNFTWVERYSAMPRGKSHIVEWKTHIKSLV